ncbi:MAG: DUF4274 domain-containing protein [Brumimicrobium sp.]|nr:DUF4274 domain-containing protein [Brumimicrobium sp.]
MTDTFLNRMNEIHNSIKGNRKVLPVEIISEDFLLEKGIIKKTKGKIVYLNTGLIAENYLMLWNDDLITNLVDLEELVIENLELRELDLTPLKQLKTITVKSCKRDSLIYIAENEGLMKLDIAELDLDGDEIGPIALYAHPEQVGKVFPKNIEKKCRDKDGYLAVTLYLAPPKHKSVQSNDFDFKFLSRFKEAELGNILREYWNQQPEYYTKYSSEQEVPDHEKETYYLLLEVERKVENDFYENKNISFKPEQDISYPSLSERVFENGRKIPDCMKQSI